MAQPALSQQIAHLEAELGVRFLDRHSRGVNLTESGKLFLSHAYFLFLSYAYFFVSVLRLLLCVCLTLICNKKYHKM